MYSQGPSYKTKLNDRSDPYETEFTARTWNDTTQVRERRGFGSFWSSHLVGGAFVRHQRSYSPTEIRSMWTIGLEQSPAYFSRSAHSASRTPSRVSSHQRPRSLSQARSIISVDSHGSRERSRKRSTSPFENGIQRVPPKRRDLHQMMDTDPDLPDAPLEESIQMPFGKDR